MADQLEFEAKLREDPIFMKKIGSYARARVKVERKRARGQRTSAAKSQDLWARAYLYAARAAVETTSEDEYKALYVAFDVLVASAMDEARRSI